MLDILKVETAQLHQDVERDNLAQYIMDGSIGQQQYEQFLRQNFMVYKAVEDFVNARYSVLPENIKPFSGYEKTNRLAKDISGFSSLPLPQPLNFASPRDLPTIIGALYVIEGSMVGGMMMSRKLQSCSQLDHIESHHFYTDEIKASSSRWKAFKDAVNEHTFTEEETAKAIESAKKVFLLFQKAYHTQVL